MKQEQFKTSRVRQFGLYPLWTSGNLRRFALSKKLLLYAGMRNDKAANNGETFICFWFENYSVAGSLLYNLLEDLKPLKGNTVGSRSSNENAYIAGFLDGDGSIMLQIKKRSDTTRGYRFMATICFYQDSRHDMTLYWIQDTLGIGYVSKRNDAMTEVRINGFAQVKLVLQALRPYIRFKSIQTKAMIAACGILEKGSNKLTKQDIFQVVDLILIIQNENYKAHRKKSKEEILALLDLTP